MITEPEGFVKWTWKNQSPGYIISVDPKQKRKIEAAFKLKSAHEGQFKRKMNHIGQLSAPISDKNYIYPIDAGYYECYIFGQNCDLRLAFDWGKSAEGTVVIVILALTDHRGIKKKTGKILNSDLEFEGDLLEESDLTFLERFL